MLKVPTNEAPSSRNVGEVGGGSSVPMRRHKSKSVTSESGTAGENSTTEPENDSSEERVKLVQPLAHIPTINIYINFEFNSSRLTKQAEQSLRSLGEALVSKELSGYKFEVAGHTDSIGNDRYNMRLSKRRAESVRIYLISEFKIAPKRLQANGYGETKLLMPDQPKKSENRRVQVTNIGSYQ